MRYSCEHPPPLFLLPAAGPSRMLTGLRAPRGSPWAWGITSTGCGGVLVARGSTGGGVQGAAASKPWSMLCARLVGVFFGFVLLLPPLWATCRSPGTPAIEGS